VELAGLPAHTLAQIEPLLVMLKALNEQIKAANKRVEEIAKADSVVQRLCSVQGVGPDQQGGEHPRQYTDGGSGLLAVAVSLQHLDWKAGNGSTSERTGG
jgi:hypothetical protein